MKRALKPKIRQNNPPYSMGRTERIFLIDSLKGDRFQTGYIGGLYAVDDTGRFTSCFVAAGVTGRIACTRRRLGIVQNSDGSGSDASAGLIRSVPVLAFCCVERSTVPNLSDFFEK